MNKQLFDLFSGMQRPSFLPHQISTIDWIIRRLEDYESLLIFHRPGSGKTYIGCLLAILMSPYMSPIIITPNSGLQSMWISNIRRCVIELPICYQPTKITTYSAQKFVSMIQSVIEGKNKNNLDNTLLIIDECHIIMSDSFVDELKKATQIFKMKLVLLTATPVMNTPESFSLMFGLMSGLSMKSLHEGSHVYEIKVSDEDRVQINSALANRVSYFNIDEDNSNTPKEVDIGTKLFGQKVILCEMTPMQKEIYNECKSLVSNEMFTQMMNNISLFGLRNIVSVKDIVDLENYKIMPEDVDFKNGYLKGKPISTLSSSCKLLHFFDLLMKGELDGKIFISIDNPLFGQLIFKSVFYDRGIEDIKNPNVVSDPLCVNCLKRRSIHTCESFAHMRYMLVSSKTTINPTALLEEFNSEENLNGEKVKIIIGSDVISVGYTLKEVKSIHFMTVPQTKSDHEQIKKRVIRQYAHQAGSQSKVKHYMYVASIGSAISESNIDDQSFDVKRLFYMQKKYINSKEIDDLLINLSANISTKTVHPYMTAFVSLELARNAIYADKPVSSYINKLTFLNSTEVDFIVKNNIVCVENERTMVYNVDAQKYPLVLPYVDFVFEADITNTRASIEIKDYIVIRKNNSYYIQIKGAKRFGLSSLSTEKLKGILAMLDIPYDDKPKKIYIEMIVKIAKETNRYINEDELD